MDFEMLFKQKQIASKKHIFIRFISELEKPDLRLFVVKFSSVFVLHALFCDRTEQQPSPKM